MKKNKNSAFVEWNRNWVVVRRHTPIILKSSLVGLLSVVIFQLVILKFDLSFENESKEPLLFISIVLNSFIYAIFAGYAFNSVFDVYKQISKSVIKNDIETFLTYRDEQLPIMIHLLLGTVSIFLIIFCMLFPYSHFYDGCIIIFSLSFLLALVFFIVIELDDYENSIWFKEKIPKEWYKIDPIEYFKNKKFQKI